MKNEDPEILPDPNPAEAESASEETAPAKADETQPADIETLIAEAEQRGYMRGINEQLGRELNRPDLYADLSRINQPAPQPASAPDELTSGFLTNIRPGVWD